MKQNVGVCKRSQNEPLVLLDLHSLFHPGFLEEQRFDSSENDTKEIRGRKSDIFGHWLHKECTLKLSAKNFFLLFKTNFVTSAK